MEPQLPGHRAALIVVDVQQGFDDSDFWGIRNNPDCEQNIRSLLDRWRGDSRPVVLVRHSSQNAISPLNPSHPGHAFKDGIDGAADLLVDKSVNSSFHGTPDLQNWLQHEHIEDVVICGITTNHCCETTARVGGNLGFRVWFVDDATHTFARTGPDGVWHSADELQRVTAANLHGEFATVVQTADVLSAR